MQVLDDYIFGNSTLHAQLATSMKILAMLAAKAPKCVTLEAIQDATRHSAQEIRKICASFNHAGFATTPKELHDAWKLDCDLGSVTLEDVYLATMATFGSGNQSGAATTAATAEPSQQQTNLDLILMQATMTINQSLFRLLRQFTLDRLNISITTGAINSSKSYSTTYSRSRELVLRRFSEFN
jgi:DNA-binding IscR family transcriptional regulator